MSTPNISKTPGGIKFGWGEEAINISLSHIREHKAGNVTCELLVETTRPDYHPHLHQSLFNLSADRSRGQLAKTLAEDYTVIDVKAWKAILAQLCTHALRLIREGEPFETLSSSAPFSPPKYLVEPLVYENLPAIVFGEKATGKTQVGLLTLLLLQIPWRDNPMGLKVNTDKGLKGLYLDWETHKSEAESRLSMMVRGNGLPEQQIDYRRCTRPFVDDIDEIHKRVTEKGIGFVLIDSLGPACAGDLIKSEIALPFFNALRTLGCPCLILGQTSKDKNGRKSIYGSTFFQYMARSIWETKSSEVPNRLSLQVGLFHRFSNLSRLSPPVGISFDYLDDAVMLGRFNPKHDPKLSSNLPLYQRIQELLEHQGKMTEEEIGLELDEPKPTVHNTLYKYKEVFVKLENRQWGAVNRRIMRDVDEE